MLTARSPLAFVRREFLRGRGEKIDDSTVQARLLYMRIRATITRRQAVNSESPRIRNRTQKMI